MFDKIRVPTRSMAIYEGFEKGLLRSRTSNSLEVQFEKFDLMAVGIEKIIR